MKSLTVLLVFLFAFSTLTWAQVSVCPTVAEIAPCTCENVDGFPAILCQLITDEEDLVKAFSANFPVTNVQSFTLMNSGITSITKNVFGNVTFKYISLETNYLESVSADAFDNSLDTLLYLHVTDCPLTIFSFPFVTLGDFSKLLEILFKNNQITNFPAIVSKAMHAIRVVDNGLQVLPKDAFINTPNINALTLNGNQIHTIEEGAFNNAGLLNAIYFENNNLETLSSSTSLNLPQLTYLSFKNNKITNIYDDTFLGLTSLTDLNLANNNIERLNATTFGKQSQLENLYLQNNDMDYIAPATFITTPLKLLDLSNNTLIHISAGTFDGLLETSLYLSENLINYIGPNSFGSISNSTIHLENNQIELLDEYWIRDLLDRGNQIFLNDNPFQCGCEIKWLFEDTTYQTRVIGQCPDGKYVSELDPNYYLTQC